MYTSVIDDDNPMYYLCFLLLELIEIMYMQRPSIESDIWERIAKYLVIPPICVHPFFFLLVIVLLKIR